LTVDSTRTPRPAHRTQFLGWLSFQPIYDLIVSKQPDLLD
jgi:hypothetical protein